MWQRSLKSGWGVIFPTTLVVLLATANPSFAQWRIVVVLALLATAGMIWHKRLRHFVLLPSCIAFASGMMLIAMNLGAIPGR